MNPYYKNGQFNAEAGSGHTLARTADSRTVTLVADLLPLFKSHARIDYSDDDALCNMYLNAGMSRIEAFTAMPVLPAAYLWDGSLANITSEQVWLPLRNCVLAGGQFGFELLSSPKLVTTPTVWPVELQVGFAAGSDMPDDLKLGLLELVTSLYEHRSNSEMQGIYVREIMHNNFARYWVPRC